MDVVALCVFAFLAGFVDSIAGGGGLIQLPALLITLPESMSLAAISGTNKFSSMFGTGFAVVQYSRRVTPPWRILLPAGLAALLFSWFGARTVHLLEREALEPVFLALMIAVAVYTFSNRRFGDLHAPRLTPTRAFLAAIVTGAGIGFYDGFFGPGTGSFLIFTFIGLFGFDFLRASASAKFVNLATNLSAVVYFAATANILYQYAVPMAICNVAGAFFGTRLAILKGNRFVRGFFLLIVGAMIVRFAWRLLAP